MSKIYNIVVTILLIIAVGTTSFFFVKYQEARKTLSRNYVILQESSRINEIAQFNKMFVDRVLLNKKPVNFEERLALENAVRKLNDADILNQWTRFVESNDDGMAQEEVKKLLSVLIEKITNKP